MKPRAEFVLTDGHTNHNSSWGPDYPTHNIWVTVKLCFLIAQNVRGIRARARGSTETNSSPAGSAEIQTETTVIV